MSDISIIIPVHNSAQLLHSQLSQLFDQLPHLQLETLIVDLGGSDQNSQIIAQYATQGFIRHIKTKKNKSLFQAYSQGAARAQNKYLLLLNPDFQYFDILFQHALKKTPHKDKGIVFTFEQALWSAQPSLQTHQKSLKELLVDTKELSAKNNIDKNTLALLCRKSDFKKEEGISNSFTDSIQTAASNCGRLLNQKKGLKEDLPKEAKHKSRQVSGKTNNSLKKSEYIKAEQRVKQLRYKLLNLGFIERACQDLEELAIGKNTHKSRLAARELALWNANKYTPEGSQKTLEWLSLAKLGERDPTKIRQNAILEAESLHTLGQTKKARTVIERELKKEIHADLFLARANLEQAISAKMTWINMALSLHGLSEITCEPDDKSVPYHGLQANPGAIKKNALPVDAPKVTVIIPAYNAQDTVNVALESVLAQSWTNLEVLVVDDCSTDATIEVVKSYIEMDQRVMLIKADVNQGPYVARNLALREATGEFVTVNDADDWSHPEKIETQARHLLENPSSIANMSQQARATQLLEFYRRGNPGYYIFNNMSSLMFRRKAVMKAVGYWDSVRFGADGEFVRRIRKVFADNLVSDIPATPLSFPRQSTDSLTGEKVFGFHGFFMGARKEYHEAYAYYHFNAESLFYDFPMRTRPFAVPKPLQLKRNSKHYEMRHFDVIIASDFRLPGGTTMSNLEEIKAQKEFKFRTGLVQISRYDLMPLNRSINPQIRDVLDDDQVQMLVYGEKVSCDVLIVRHPPVLQVWQKFLPDIYANDIRVIVNQPPKDHYGYRGKVLFDIKECIQNIQSYFGNLGTWHPIGPLVRDTLFKHHAEELDLIDLSEEIWANIIDTKAWKRSKRPARGKKTIIGRHSRDHKLKWPSDPTNLTLIYPETERYEIRILGGAEAPKNVLGYLPSNWQVYNFGSIHPKEFLKELDLFVYYPHPDWIESFGRVIFEAMAVGVPVILPHVFSKVFGKAAVYASPKDVVSKIDKLMHDERSYEQQVQTAYQFVEDNHSYIQHKKRISKIINAGFAYEDIVSKVKCSEKSL